MKVRLIYIMASFLLFFSCATQQFNESEENAIKEVLMVQQQAWNQADIEAFMEGYWKSEELRFTSSGTTNMGWQQTLDGYKKRYPDAEAMGILTFEIFDIFPVTANAAALNGGYHLKRKNDELSGFFNLIFRKMDGEWKIISDMTCGS